MTNKCKDIVGFIEEFAPKYLAEDWDNVGLMIGSFEKEVSRVLVCLDVTAAVAEEAISQNIDLIVSHHPLVFKELKQINTEDIKGKVIDKLIKNDISVYSAHTNLDVAEGGVNEQLAKALILTEIKELGGNSIFSADLKSKHYGIGKVGVLEYPLTPDEFVLHIKNKLNIDHLKIIGRPKANIKNVAVFCGSFDEKNLDLISDDVDVFVTGDIKYHTAMDICEMNLFAVDAGHFSTEIIVVPALAKEIAEKFKEITVLCSSTEFDPIKCY